MLEFALKNDIVLWCLQRDTTKYLKLLRGPFSNHWKITDLFLRRERCSVSEKWLHENGTVLSKTCIRSRHYKRSKNFENRRKLSL